MQTDYPKYLVVCTEYTDTPSEDGQTFETELRPATHRLFDTDTDAKRYMESVSPSRNPFIVTLYKPLYW